MNLFEFLVTSAVMSGVYYLGTKQGKEISSQEQKEKNMQDIINDLRRKLNDLDNKSANSSFSS